MPLTSPPPSPFGVGWDRLALADLLRFLGAAPAPTENDLWEAKGGEINKDPIYQAVSAFGNSMAGGYLVLGVGQAKSGAPWTIDGWKFPPEPELWVTQVAHAIADCPAIDVRAYPLGGGRHIAVLAIEPAPIPPVITPSGCVFERVGPSSPPVTSGVALRRLVAGGDAARESARSASLAMQDSMLNRPIEVAAGVNRPYVTVALGLAPAGMPLDADDRIVSQPLVDAFRAAVLTYADAFRPDPQIRAPGRALFGWVGGAADNGYSIRANTKAVGVAWRDPKEGDAWWSVVESVLLDRMWGMADGLIQQLGGYGPAHLSLYVFRPANAQHLHIWTAVGALDDAELTRVKEELRREAGEAIIKP